MLVCIYTYLTLYLDIGNHCWTSDAVIITFNQLYYKSLAKEKLRSIINS